VEDRLFATLDTLTREFEIQDSVTSDERRVTSAAVLNRRTAEPPRPPSRRVRLIDTVGFIRKLPHQLVASFRATLEEVTRADVLLHVIDASHPEWEAQVDVVNETLHELGAGDRPVIHVFNKMDLVESPEAFRAMVRERYERAVFVTAAGGAVGELIEALGKAGKREE